MWISFIFLLWREYFLKVSNNLKVPSILVSIKALGPSIDLSTCVSAARLKIAIGLYFFNNK